MLSLQRPYEMYTADLHKILVCQEGVRPTIFQDWPCPIQDVLRAGWAPSSVDRPSMQLICKRVQEMLDSIEQSKDCRDSPLSQNVEVDGSDVHAPTSLPTSSSSFSAKEDVQSYDAISNFIESWTNSLCTLSSQASSVAKREDCDQRPRKSLLRTIEAHLVADTAAGGQLMMRHSQSAYNGNKWGTPDRDYQNQFAKHLRSSYL